MAAGPLPKGCSQHQRQGLFRDPRLDVATLEECRQADIIGSDPQVFTRTTPASLNFEALDDLTCCFSG